MALSNAEKVRRYRERQKEKEKVASLTLDDVFRAPFYKFFQDSPNRSNVDLPLELVGINPPDFEDDRGPEAFAFKDATAGLDDPFDGAAGSKGRAEIMVGCLIDAAVELAEIINAYKRREIEARLAEIEASDLSEPGSKKAALQDAARLTKMLDQLDKQVRWTFPQWKVTG